MDCNKGFASNYMLLKIEEVKFFDLISLLFSSNIGKRKFIDSSQVKEESFQRRILIFISVLVQKLLQLFSIPLLIFITLVEFVLNLFNDNGNSFFKLLLNLLSGKLKIPEKTSENFLSFVAFLDKRKDLDKNIKHGNAKYEAALSIMASKAAYENEAYCYTTVNNWWKMEFLGFYNFWNDYEEKVGTQAFIFRNKTNNDETIVVAFRGTTFSSDSFCTDIDISWYEFEGIGRIHAGFMKALGLQKSTGWPKELDQSKKIKGPFAYYAIREILRELLAKNENAKFIVTGHSLGGALAILFTTILVFHEEENLLKRLSGVYTFGQPRVGDENFAKYMEKKFKKYGVRYCRFVYCSDMIPRVPSDDSTLMLFKHFGTCVYFNRYYQAKLLEEEPNKNYYSLVGGIKMAINALMELIRSFTIELDQGEEYKDTRLMLLLRFIGLVIPGFPPHSPAEYVNATRIGYSTSFQLEH